jgi:hypothetical protein
MFKRLTSAHLAILIAAAVVVACAGDQALVSPRLGGGAPPLGAVADSAGTRVHPVQRQDALVNDRSWSFDVGPEGTLVRDGPTGLTIDVPPGAVASSTHITVIALKGTPLAYRFEPHGLQFAAPVRLVQSLRQLKVRYDPLGIPALFGGYFADDSLSIDAVTGEARVIEVLPVRIDIKGQAALLDIRHFSGYTVASADRDSTGSWR